MSLRIQELLMDVHQLIDKNNWSELKNRMNAYHAADIAYILNHLNESDRKRLFELIVDVKQSAEVLSELDESIAGDLLEEIDKKKISDLFTEMDSDDAADILGAMPDDTAQEVLDQMSVDDSKEVVNLLKYPSDTAGGIMNPDIFFVHESNTVGDAIKQLRDLDRDEYEIYYIYVTDNHGHFIGVLSIRDLIVGHHNVKISNIMISDALVSVTSDLDQEDVARIVARYNLAMLPVVNHQNQLIGVITFDDVIDVIREEATEDFLRMAGAGDDLSIKSTWESFKTRLPWLFASWLGGIFALQVISSFENVLKASVALAGFIPIIMGMGGNAGTQSSTLVVRGLSTRRIQLHRMWHVLFKEVQVGFWLGLTYAILLGSVAYWQYPIVANLSIVVGVSVCASMLVAVTVGSMIPMLLELLKIDPAIATGPFVTTAVDVLGILIYFCFATALIV